MQASSLSVFCVCVPMTYYVSFYACLYVCCVFMWKSDPAEKDGFSVPCATARIIASDSSLGVAGKHCTSCVILQSYA